MYTSAMALLTRFVRHMLDLDAVEAYMEEYAARIDSYLDND